MTADIVQLNPDLAPELGSDERALIVDVEGFEGPLDLLLTLARQQKVDLAKISILALADQYLVFIDQARRLRLELAADYLVMAAWLAYLKSRLLLPDAPGAEGMSAAEMANALALRLKQLEAIRAMAEKLFDRHQLGRHVFGRGDPEPIAEIKHPKWSATLYDLLSAYATERQRHVLARVRFAKRAATFAWRRSVRESSPCNGYNAIPKLVSKRCSVSFTKNGLSIMLRSVSTRSLTKLSSACNEIMTNSSAPKRPIRSPARRTLRSRSPTSRNKRSATSARTLFPSDPKLSSSTTIRAKGDSCICASIVATCNELSISVRSSNRSRGLPRIPPARASS